MDRINLNARPDPLLGKLPEREGRLTRVALIAIPFLSLYKPTRMGVSVIGGTIQVISLWKSNQSNSEKFFKASAYAMTIYLSIYRPKTALAITLSVQTLSDIKEGKVYDILSRLIYFSSIYTKRPELIVASLLMEIGKELKEAYGEYNKEKYPEVLAKLLMVALRVYQTKEEVSRVSRRYFGKEVTQEDWDQLSQEKDISKALKEKNYSDTIKNIKVKPMPNRDLSEVCLKDMVFEKVDFSDSDLGKSTIENVAFNHCKMKDIFLYRVSLTNVVWNSCQLEKGTFYLCSGSGLHFKGCDLTRFCMAESIFSDLVIEASTLYGSSFLNTVLSDSILKGCDLLNVLLCGANFEQQSCAKNRITKPVVALTWHFEDRGSWGAPVPNALEDQGALTLKFPIYPKDIDVKDLGFEVQGKLKTYTTYRLSRAQELLDDSNLTPEIEKIKRRATQVMSYADVVILSGGENVEKEFYSDSFYGNDYRRSLMEFAMIHHGKPVMGICRGCQVLNTYFGGTIKDVPFQGRQEPIDYTNDPLGKRLKKKGGRVIVGYSAHSQAADKMGAGLRIILMKRGIVKAFMNQEGTVIGTQFHPEIYIKRKMVKEKMGKADLKQLITLLGSVFLDKDISFFQTGPVLTEGNEPQLNQVGEEAIIKFFNQLLSKVDEQLKKLESNQIFFKLFLERVKTNRDASILQPSESALGG